MRIIVKKSPKAIHSGYVIFNQECFPCAVGRSGFGGLKKEGDGISPIGRWRFRKVFYRQDRISRPITSLPVQSLNLDDGWCDEPWDPNYNRYVKLPYQSRSENLWRDDELYNIIVVLTHNYIPRVQERGSAIFMHVAKPHYPATEGCIALKVSDLRRLLGFIDIDSSIDILG